MQLSKAKAIFLGLGLVLACDVCLGPTREARANFVRGDVDANGIVDFNDAINGLIYLFLGFFIPPCLKAADVNDTEIVDITDSLDLLVWLFLGSFPPPVPTPLDVTLLPNPVYDAPTSCAPDSTPGGLGCAAFPPCPLLCP
jgi:hypothetical protein